MTKTSKKDNKPVKSGLIKLIGRPVKYDNVKELQKIIMGYFKENNTPDNPPTMTGLAMTLGLSRQGLFEYSNKDMFSDSIKRAKQFVEEVNERMLITKKTSPIGNIFNLKNNFAWRDDRTVIMKHQNIASIMGGVVGDIDAIDGELVEDDPLLIE